MDVIICDIDGTVLDVEPRIAASLVEIGVEYGGEAIRVSRTLPRHLRGPFYDAFLSNKHLHLDRPIAASIDRIAALQQETGLPLVYLSGRLSGMEAATRHALEAIGLPFEAMVLKPQRERMRGTAAWKVAAIRDHGYEPLHILDDDAEVLAALGLAFPAAKLYDLNGARTVPGGG